MADEEPRSGHWRTAGRPVLDRQDERRAIDEMLDRVNLGFSGALIIRGGHGVGKTTLLEYAISAAAGFQISAVAGVESEIAMDFGLVHQLLIPFLPLIGDLPMPQRHAIEVAFGMRNGEPPEPILVGLACLTLLSRAAEDKPVICAIDDAQWIDAESVLVLGFVARRLYADRVAMVVAVSDTDDRAAFEQLRAIDLCGLPDDAAAELLRSVVGAPLEARVVSRIITDTGGNALALVEVGSQLTGDELAHRAYRPEPIPVGSQLQQRYLQQVSRLPSAARKLALLIAAEGSGGRGLIRRAAAAAKVDADAAEEALEAAYLITVSGNSVRFRHPLIRAAVYNGSSDAERRRAHLLLSRAAVMDNDDERAVWHRAAAATGLDEGVAADLQKAAERASGRGAWATAAALMRRSIDLTADDDRRARREVGLAQAELVIGHPEAAERVADEAVPRLPDDRTRGRAKLLSGESLLAQGRDGEAADLLVDASVALESDPAAATEALLSAFNAAIWAGGAEPQRVATVAARAPRSASPPRVTDTLLAGYRARFTSGYDAAAGPLRTAVGMLRADNLDPGTGVRWFGLGATAAGSLWDDEALIDISERWVRVTRRLGAVTYLPVALACRAFTDWLTGRLDDAADRWAEMQELMASLKHAMPAGDRSVGLIHAYRGEFDAARAAGQALIRGSTARGQGGIADMGRDILAVTNLSAGEPQAAFEYASQVVEHDPAFTAELTLPDLIESAVRIANHDAAAKGFAKLDSRTRTSGTRWALGLRARCEALISDGEPAEQAYLESIGHLERSHAAVDLARAHLLYGQWLRRVKRRRDARRQLRIAEEMYEVMGAEAYAGVARDELRATGERARSRTPETQLDLTPQEGRVANLAATGLTNSEIAGELFISPSTVEYHLSKVFRKLGVRSRTRLAVRLAGGV